MTSLNNAVPSGAAGLGRFASYAMLVAICVAAWPAWTMAMNWSSRATTLDTASFLSILPESQRVESDILSGTTWQPHMSGYDAHLMASVENPRLPTVDAHAFVYISQTQGKEMISSANVLVRSRDPVWRITQRAMSNLQFNSSAPLPVEKHVIESNTTRLLVWRWYAVGEVFTTSKVKVKLLEVRDRLLFRQSRSVVYLLQTSAEHAEAEQAMQTAALAIIGQN